MTIVRMLFIWLGFLTLSTFSEPDYRSTSAYLDHLAKGITEDQSAMVNAETWRRGEAHRSKRLLRMLGLDPLPERTPLNARNAGAPLELERCVFQRVVFESAPGLFVAAHLYIPKGVSLPAPAVIYVPGHSRRDKYLPHAMSYAEQGYIVIGLPMVGEEGRIEDDTGKCGHYGPYHEHFDWYAKGYSAAGVEVWDTMRAVDYLESLKTEKGGPMVDPDRIGLAGLSGGSARTFWVAAAEPRIKAAVACQGFTTIADYDATIPSTCDVHLFYNYYHQSYAEVYGNVAPRALRVIQTTEDPLYKNPRPVAEAMTRLYKTIEQPDKFSYVTFSGGHGYTPDVIAREREWLAQWLEPEKPREPSYSDSYREQLKANHESLSKPENLQCFTGSRAGWLLLGQPVDARPLQEAFGPKPPKAVVTDRPSFEAHKHRIMEALKSEVLVHSFHKPQAGIVFEAPQVLPEGKQQRNGVLTVDKVLTRNCRLIQAGQGSAEITLLLAPQGLDAKQAQGVALTRAGRDVLILEVAQMKDKHMHRYAALVGHTETSLRIEEALAAARVLQADYGKLSIHGAGAAAVAALFTAVLDPAISSVTLEDCPDHFGGDTALLGILRHADIPQAAAMLFPRPVELVGELGALVWTRDLYRALGQPAAFTSTQL